MESNALFFKHAGQLIKIASDDFTKPNTQPANSDLVVALLFNKSMNHVMAAIELQAMGKYYQETIVLIRSAYEAVVCGIYIQQNPSEVAHYEAHGVMCNLRNMMEILAKAEMETNVRNELSKQAFELKEALAKEGLRYFRNWSRADLDDFSKVKSASNKALFRVLREMLDAITYDDDNDWLKESFELYNLGSQFAHSQMETIFYCSFGKSEHPSYTRLHICRFSLMFLNFCYTSLQSLKFMNPNRKAEFDENILRCARILEEMIAKEMNSSDQRLEEHFR